MLDPHDEIAALEKEIEVLQDRVEQGRKVALVAKAMTDLGGAVLVFLLGRAWADYRSP